MCQKTLLLIERFGIFPSWGLSQKLPRLVGVNRAKECSLIASPIDAQKALLWGLVNKVVPPGEHVASARELARKIVQNHKELVVKYKAVINDGLLMNLEEGRILEKV